MELLLLAFSWKEECFKRSAKIRTALCGCCEAVLRTRPSAGLPTEHSNVSGRLMEYRFPTSSRYLPTGRAAFGWEGRQRLSIGTAGVARRSTGARGSRAWRVVPMDRYGWAYPEVTDLNNSRTVPRNRS